MIHPSAIIADSAKIGANVQVGPYSIIHDNVSIGDDSVIEAYCEIGIMTNLSKNPTLSIGPKANIRSHATIYQGSIIGPQLTTGHFVCIRENSQIGHNVQLGSRSDIQGDCSIGNSVKIHADVHIGKLAKVGSYVWLYPEVLLTNDPMPPSKELIGVTIEDYVVVAAKTILLPGITLHEGCVIGASSHVKTNIAKRQFAHGCPAQVICPANLLRMPHDPSIKAYPWIDRWQ